MSPRSARRLVLSRPILEILEPRSLLASVNTNPQDDGPVLANVAVESVFYGQTWSSPALSPQMSYLNGFLGIITNSTFMDMLKVYGAGRGTFTAGPTGSLTGFTGTTPIDDTQIQQFPRTRALERIVDPVPGGNALYRVPASRPGSDRGRSGQSSRTLMVIINPSWILLSTSPFPTS